MSTLPGFLGESPGVAAVRSTIERLLPQLARGRRAPPILLQGETGTGKGLLARALHDASPRAAGPFVEVDCPAIPVTLLEAELFGFEPGAFTDARRAKPGLAEAAHRGTLFLDEVASLPESLQAKLLNALESRRVRRLGATRSQPVDVLIVAATNTDLAAAVREGRFRQDLYHRLAVLTLTLPPLRERGDDVLLLADAVLARICADHGIPPKTLDDDARAALLRHPWPGNVRELVNLMERVALLTDGNWIAAGHLGLMAPGSAVEVGLRVGPSGQDSLRASLESFERAQLDDALRAARGNVTLAADRLGLPRGTLRYRLARLGLAGDPAARRRSVARPASVMAAFRPDGGLELAGPTAVRWEPRRVTFVRTRLTLPVGPEPAPGSDRALRPMVDKVKSFGGRVEQLSAAGLDASFGLEPIEDAPRRAAHAAMAIQGAVQRAGGSGPERPRATIGIHANVVMVSQASGAARLDEEGRRRTESALEVLLGGGPPGAIVVSADTVPLLERRFEMAPASTTEGGRPSGWRLVGCRRTALELWGRMGRFVGREHELALLQSRGALVRRGQGQIVALVGGPGVGKSRLVWEFVHSEGARGHRLLETSCLPHEKATPWLPVIELLRGFFEISGRENVRKIEEKISATLRELDASPATHAPALLGLLDRPVDDPGWRALDPPQRRRRTLEAVKHLLLRSSRSQPLLLVFEDLHWVDSGTQALLDLLVEGLATAPVLLLATYRDEYLHNWSGTGAYTQLPVDPLPPERAAELLQALMGEDPALEPLRGRLIERTEGNPFFLEESVRALVEANALVGEHGFYRLGTPATLQVPATVEEVLAARINRLPPPDKDLLQSAAVIGKDVPLVLLQAIAGLPVEAFEPCLARLHTAELLQERSLGPDAEYTFKHALTHEVAYGSLSPDHRRALHARLVQAIGRLYADRLAEQAERLAHHAVRAEDWAKAVLYLHQAGARASGRSAYREAALRFEQALGALAHLPCSPQRVAQAIDLRFDLRNVLAPLGEHRRILGELLEAEALAHVLDDRRRLGWALAYMCQEHRRTAEYGRALEAGQRALLIAREVGDSDLESMATHYLGQTYCNVGQFSRAVDLFRRDLERQVPLRPVMARTYLTWTLASLGRFPEALAYAGEALLLAERDGRPYTMAAALAGLGISRLVKGDLHDAVPLLERGLALVRSWHLVEWLAGFAPALGSAYLLSGRLAESLALLEEEAERQASATGGMMSTYSLVLGQLGEGYLVAGRPTEALKYARLALDLSRKRGEQAHEARVRRVLGQIAWRGDPPEAEQSERYLRQAIGLASELGMRPLIAHCHLGLGRLCRCTGNQAKSDEHLQTAVTMYREMDMGFWLAQAEAALREAGGRGA